MSVLSSGHLATDFASGAVPALLPFFTVKFDLSYTLTAVLILAALISSSVVQPLFGLWSDRRGALWLLPAGLGARRCRARSRRRRTELSRARRARVHRRHRDRRLPSRRSEVRGVPERQEASEWHVALQHRREPRLRPRTDHRHAARPLARPRPGRAAGVGPRPDRLGRRARRVALPRAPAATARRAAYATPARRTTSGRCSSSRR